MNQSGPTRRRDPGRPAPTPHAGTQSAAVRRKFDVIMAWSVDRLGRSLQDLVTLLSEIHAKGVDLYLPQQGIDTTTPSGKAMFQMMEVFAEFERAMIRERVLAGLKRARAKGKKLGRPMISSTTERAIRADIEAGLDFRRIMARHQVGTSVIQRIKAALAAGGVKQSSGGRREDIACSNPSRFANALSTKVHSNQRIFWRQAIDLRCCVGTLPPERPQRPSIPPPTRGSPPCTRSRPGRGPRSAR